MCTLCDAVRPGDYQIFLTGKGNFRHDVATIQKYKGNRDKSRKPRWYNEAREYLIKYYNAKVCDGVEADDELAKAQSSNTIICSIDKDLLQVPGLHYNWVKDEKYEVSPQEGTRRLWEQVLTGDATDNIPGIKGIGPVKAKKLLKDCATEEEMREVCIKTWEEYLQGDSPPAWAQYFGYTTEGATVIYYHWEDEDREIDAHASDIVDELYRLLKVG